jgi:hypothetical protein
MKLWSETNIDPLARQHLDFPLPDSLWCQPRFAVVDGCLQAGLPMP